MGSSLNQGPFLGTRKRRQPSERDPQRAPKRTARVLLAISWASLLVVSDEILAPMPFTKTTVDDINLALP